MEIEQIRGATEVMKHMAEEGDIEDKKKLESIEEELRDKEEELECLESLNSSLIIKERRANEEVQEARKQLIFVSIWNHLIVKANNMCLIAYLVVQNIRKYSFLAA